VIKSSSGEIDPKEKRGFARYKWPIWPEKERFEKMITREAEHGRRLTNEKGGNGDKLRG